MRGIAAARAQQARSQLIAVDSYAATIAVAIGRALALAPSAHPDGARRSARPALVLFCAEQGFAGAFSERVLDAAGADLATSELFLIGTTRRRASPPKGASPPAGKAPCRRIRSAYPKLADRIAEALYARIATGEIDRLDAVFSQWQPGHGIHVERRRLFPFDMSAFPRPTDANAPLLNLAPRGASERTHRGLHARAALQRRAPRLRGGERGAHGSDGRGA